MFILDSYLSTALKLNKVISLTFTLEINNHIILNRKSKENVKSRLSTKAGDNNLMKSAIKIPCKILLPTKLQPIDLLRFKTEHN
jgi:hypothetical protein